MADIKTYIGADIPPQYFTLCQKIIDGLIELEMIEQPPPMKNITLTTDYDYQTMKNWILVSFTADNELWESSYIADIGDYDWKVETIYIYDVEKFDTGMRNRIIIYQ